MQKLISFPDPIYDKLLKRAKKIGFTFSEYMRMMSVQHLQQPELLDEIEVLDDETSKRVEASLEDFKNGRFKILGTKEEIKNYFSK